MIEKREEDLSTADNPSRHMSKTQRSLRTAAAAWALDPNSIDAMAYLSQVANHDNRGELETSKVAVL